MRDSWSQRAEADGVLGFGADDRVTECLAGTMMRRPLSSVRSIVALSATACAMAWLTLSLIRRC